MVCLAAFCAARALCAEDAASDSSVDQLFETPQADVETQSSDASQLISPFHAQPLTVTGALTAYAGGVAGVSDTKDASGNWNGGLSPSMSPGLSFVPSLTFAARPDESIRFQGTLSFPFATTNMFAPVINELFFDYTLFNEYYFRIGKHLVSWGVTRIFDAGGDLMENSSNGLNVKLNMPIGIGGITTVILTPASISSSYSWKDFTYGLQGDIPIGKAELILSATGYRYDSDSLPFRGTAVLKTSLGPIDLFAEGVEAATLSLSPSLQSIVSGFYWERTDPEYKLYGEYYFNATDTSLRDHRASLVAGANQAFGSPFDIAIQWTHAFIDNSGIVVPGFSVDLWNHVSLQIGFPIRYGNPGSYFLVNSSPSVTTSVIPTDVLTWQERYGLLFRFKMTTGF
jgi:hypothetical protein